MFDYGGQVAEKEDNYHKWNKVGNRIALVDADLLPYRIGFVIDDVTYARSKFLVDEGHVSCIEETEQFSDSFNDMCKLLNKWVREAGCDAAILYSTKSDANFRLNIAYTDEYKGQRTQDKPPFFSELKESMTSKLDCELCSGIEADDALSIKAWESYLRDLKPQGISVGSPQHKELCDTVTISIDKDSTITPTWHYNPDTRKLEWVDELGTLNPKYKNAMVNAYEYVPTGQFKKGQPVMKRVCVGKKPSEALVKLKGTGLKFFYAQIIMGDMADNYKGLQGKGMTAAYNALVNCKTEKELYLTTLALYKEVYGTGEHWCPNYLGTEEYKNRYIEVHGVEPPDWSFWKGKGAWLTAYDRMLEQGRLAWMMTFEGDIWRKDKGRIINPFDKEFWHDK